MAAKIGVDQSGYSNGLNLAARQRFIFGILQCYYMSLTLKILPQNILPEYQARVSEEQLKAYQSLTESELSQDDFNFYTSVSAVFSSKIEGEDIDLDSFVKHKRFGIEFQPDHTQKTDDLYDAYRFVARASCNAQNLEKAHAILTRNILPEHRQGKIRTGNMYVTTPDGKIEYVAARPEMVHAELELFYSDLEALLAADLSTQECFYYAAMVHLVFVKIHPFEDGNGRSARLLEKWFLAIKLGEKAWRIPSERHYYSRHAAYYSNIRALGLEYEELDYGEALPFLRMLADCMEDRKD